LSKDSEVCLAWLAQALQQLRPEGQKKVVGYLEAVLEEVIFETKMTSRSDSLVPLIHPRSAWKMSSWNQHNGTADREQMA
jgi:hypothetical protein